MNKPWLNRFYSREHFPEVGVPVKGGGEERSRYAGMRSAAQHPLRGGRREDNRSRKAVQPPVLTLSSTHSVSMLMPLRTGRFPTQNLTIKIDRGVAAGRVSGYAPEVRRTGMRYPGHAASGLVELRYGKPVWQARHSV